MKMVNVNQFTGCLLGALVGDCIGAPLEYTPKSGKLLDVYFQEIKQISGKIKKYTDDTAMMKSLAKTLIENKGFNDEYFAKIIVEKYFAEPNRNYGSNAIKIFTKIREQNFQNIYKPAMESFCGKGSFGNGGAMRIAPIALYYYDNVDLMVFSAIQQTKVTHCNDLAINGALVLCFAIRKCLLTNLNVKIIDTSEFIDKLIMDILSFEHIEPYVQQLNHVKELLKNKDHVDTKTIVSILGNDMSAIRSVPTAIYCFLKPFIMPRENQTLYTALSLGGDTDTIANMACSLSGAFFGKDYICVEILTHCEAYEEITNLAKTLHHIKSLN